VRRELDAERLRTAELRREAEIVAREAQRLRDELSQQRSAAKRRERAPSANEASAVPPPATSAVVPVAEAPPSAPRAE
jgi:dsDNA-specific endonuclease/ATPase MutS2